MNLQVYNNNKEENKTIQLTEYFILELMDRRDLLVRCLNDVNAPSTFKKDWRKEINQIDKTLKKITPKN